MTEEISQIQRKMYDFIENYIKVEGMPPTNREIGRAMNIASIGHVDYYLTVMEKKGMISRQEKKSRGVKLSHQSSGIHVVGSIAADKPLEIFPSHEQSVNVAYRSEDDTNKFALVVRDSSLAEAHIDDGDYVIVKPQSTCRNGDVIVVVHLQENKEGVATLGRFFQETDQVRLQPANSGLKSVLIPNNGWHQEWQVQGKVLAIFRSFNNSGDASSILYPTQTFQSKKDLEVINQTVDDETANGIGDFKAPQERQVVGTSEKEQIKNKYKGEIGGLEELEQGKEDVKEVHKIVDLVVQQEAAYERISLAAKTTREQLNQIHSQGHHQAKYWFQFSIVAAIIGFLVLLGSVVVAILTTNVALGVLTSYGIPQCQDTKCL